MRWTHSPPGLVRAFDSAVRSLRGVEQRKMFGYPAVFVKGNMFAGLVRTKIILRLGEADRERFLAVAGARPFIAMSGRRMREWVVVPPAMTRSKPKLKAWLGRALAHTRSKPVKTLRRTRRKV